MSSRVPIHGRNHRPGGVDPIPGLPTSSPLAGSYEETVVGLSDDLLGYWRLGESSEPFADSSGLVPPAPLSIDGFGTAPIPDVPGALVDNDDGAVEFPHDGTSAAKILRAPGVSGPGSGVIYRFADQVELTASAWVKVKASAIARPGFIVACMTHIVSGDYLDGWSLHALYPSRQIQYWRIAGGTIVEISTAGGVVADQWYFVAGTYDGTDMRLYLNAVLVGEEPSTLGEVAGNPTLTVGGWGGGVSPIAPWFYGSVDEVAVWPRALSLTEIETLYASGIGETAPAGGSVLISDGSGASTWGQVTTPAIADEAVTPAKLEPGTDGEVLRTSGSSVEWGLATVRVNY